MVHGPVERLVGLADDPALASVEALCHHFKGLVLSFDGRPRREHHRDSVLGGGPEAHSRYRSGYTLKFLDLEQHMTAVRRFAALLEYDLNLTSGTIMCQAWATLGAKAAPPHFDFDDTFTVQLTGTKIWRLTKRPLIVDPLLDWVFGRPPSPRLAEYWRSNYPRSLGDCPTEVVELRPGSVLWFPAGVGHTTTARSESLAVTFGLRDRPRSGILAEELTIVLNRDPRWRRRWPNGAEPLWMPSYEHEAAIALSRAFERLAERRSPRLERATFERRQSAQVESRRRSDHLAIRVKTTTGVVVVKAPVATEALLGWILRQDRFGEAAAVYAAHGLTPREALVLLASFEDASLLRRVRRDE